MVAARRPGGSPAAARLSETLVPGKAQRGAGVVRRDGPASETLFRALHSCNRGKVPIAPRFQTLSPGATTPAAVFPLSFQRLGRPVKRCCSTAGLLLPSQMCSGAVTRVAPRDKTRTPFTVAAPFPFAAVPARVLPCKVTFKPQSQRSADVSPGVFAPPPAARAETGGASPRDAPTQFPFANPPQRTSSGHLRPCS